MKYVKILGLLAVAAAALMAFAGTASATTVTSPVGTAYFGPLHAQAEGHAILHNPTGKIQCASTVNGHVEVNGGEAAGGTITSLTFSSCTEGWHVTTVGDGGTLSVKSNGNHTGDVFSSGATVEATVGGITCRYATANTTVGTLTDSTITKKTATMDISANIPFHSGSIFCGTAATPWTGSYEISTPDSIVID